MKDNEIIKALECCCKGSFVCGANCPRFENGTFTIPACRFELLGNVLDLTNRQKAEIEKKDKLIEIADKMVESLKAEVKRLRNSFDAQANLIEKKSLAYDRICVKHRNELKTAKSEAIKEFADKYEKAVLPLLTSATLDKKDGIHACLDILKEMVGE